MQAEGVVPAAASSLWPIASWPYRVWSCSAVFVGKFVRKGFDAKVAQIGQFLAAQLKLFLCVIVGL